MDHLLSRCGKLENHGAEGKPDYILSYIGVREKKMETTGIIGGNKGVILYIYIYIYIYVYL